MIRPYFETPITDLLIASGLRPIFVPPAAKATVIVIQRAGHAHP